MNKKMSKRQKDIKSKLMAAICMLLVSSIMMVSSTYAWFTLSTAPEVTGIQTAVGANGNLEMALQPYSGVLSEITTGESDSTKLPLERNITWGNLVDVSDKASYGMDKLVLYPAELNVADGKIGEQPLKTPVYGADGRVSEVNANTLTGAFDPVKQQFSESMTIGEKTYGPDNGGVAKGVRAIGVSSGLSARELAHRNAIAAAVAEKGGANTDAGKTLSRNGADIGKIAIAQATGGQSSYTQDEIAGIKAMVTDLNAVVNRIESALKSYLLAYNIAPGTAETTYADLVTKINGAADLATAEGLATTVPTEAAYTTAKTQLAAMRTKLSSANGILQSSGNVTWDQLSDWLTPLIDMNKITVNGMTVAQVKSDEGADPADGKNGKDELLAKLSETGYTAQLRMPSGSGIFADIADFTGTYSTSFKMDVTFNGQTIPNVNAEMYAVATYAYLDDVKAIPAMAYTEGGGNTSTAKPLDTYYGYILDLAFRTNADNSYLQLQPEAVNRIYSDGTNSETMGHGANMKFKTDSVSFGKAGVKALMEQVRIVFFDTADNSIIAYAKLDAGNATDEGDFTVMPIMLTDATFTTPKADDASTTDIDESVQIMELPKNTATALSVMVYLDGKTMTNADVAADAAQSMYGTMNLQFSSSADLVPMDYADLKAERSEGSTGPISYAPMNKVTKPNGYTVAAYTDNNGNMGFTLNGGVLDDTYTVQVKIGDTTLDATKETFATLNGYKISHTGLTSDTAVEIIVTAPATP